MKTSDNEPPQCFASAVIYAVQKGMEIPIAFKVLDEPTYLPGRTIYEPRGDVEFTVLYDELPVENIRLRYFVSVPHFPKPPNKVVDQRLNFTGPLRKGETVTIHGLKVEVTW